MAKALQPFEQIDAGGVDSRSNPVNMPRNRSLRCLNWVPKQAGFWELRWGYSTVSMSTVSNSTISSIFPYRTWDGHKYVIFMQGTTWQTIDTSNGNVTTPTVRGAAIASSAKGAGYFANNRFHYGNGTDQKFFDSTTWRDSGLPALNPGQVSAVVVGQGSTDANALPAAILSGYQFYACIYNPNTGHIGNRIAIGARLANNTTSDISFGGLPQIGAQDTEWVKLLGRTGDGAQVPYAMVDGNGNLITVAGNTTTAIVTTGLINGAWELPTRNGIIPSQCNMFCVAGDFAYAGDTGSPYLRRSGDMSQAVERGNTVLGRPEQSWAPNDIDTFPTAEAMTGMWEVDSEVFCGTLHDCAISTNLSGIQQWVGQWEVGIAGRRAGTKCGSHGFCWLSADKQLLTLEQGVPVGISDEYELAELAQIGDSFISTVELVYYRNVAQNKDEVRIEGQLQNGTPYTVIHDFKLREVFTTPGSIYGQGYSSQFQGPLGTVFTSATVRDGNGKLQIFAGATNGQLYQLYTGADDVGNQYNADLILLVNGGTDRPQVPFIDWYGDGNIDVAIGTTLSTSLNPNAEFAFTEVTPPSDPAEAVQGFENNFLYRAKINAEIQKAYARFQLMSHSADGNMALNSPPHLPLEWYGRLYEIIPSIGDERER